MYPKYGKTTYKNFFKLSEFIPCSIFGTKNLFKIRKNITKVKTKKLFCASITKSNKNNINILKLSCDFRAFLKRTNITPKSGGKKRYIVDKLSYKTKIPLQIRVFIKLL